MMELLSSQIDDNLLPFISQDFSNSKSEEENMVESQVPIQQASRNFFPEGPLWPFPQGPRKPPKDRWYEGMKWD
uniref:Peroxin-13 n=1 Tax=Strongyloides papillosus TaxID=174720 RepID=A0A0N5BL66_STREA